LTSYLDENRKNDKEKVLVMKGPIINGPTLTKGFAKLTYQKAFDKAVF
jgi:hypothetical protein